MRYTHTTMAETWKLALAPASKGARHVPVQLSRGPHDRRFTLRWSFAAQRFVKSRRRQMAEECLGPTAYAAAEAFLRQKFPAVKAPLDAPDSRYLHLFTVPVSYDTAPEPGADPVMSEPATWAIYARATNDRHAYIAILARRDGEARYTARNSYYFLWNPGHDADDGRWVTNRDFTRTQTGDPEGDAILEEITERLRAAYSWLPR